MGDIIATGGNESIIRKPTKHLRYRRTRELFALLAGLYNSKVVCLVQQ